MKWMMVLSLLAGPVWAQNETVHKIVPLKYADPYAAQSLLKHFGVNMQADRQMKVLALTGPGPAVETAEAALKQIDIPGAAQKDVDLTVYFVVGRDDTPTEGAIPQDLQGTIAALKQTFPYKNYDLLDTLALRSRAGSQARANGQIGSGNLTSFSVLAVRVEGEGVIRIDGLRATVRQLQGGGGPNPQYVDVSGVSTDVVDVKEGQKLVVGRSSLAGSRAMFLVLIAKVAQ